VSHIKARLDMEDVFFSKIKKNQKFLS